MTALCVVLVILVASGVIAAIFYDREILVGVTLALMILAALSAHREAVFDDETAVSGSMVVICACIVGMGATSLAAPMLCAFVAALHREHIRDRQLLKLVVNSGATVVPALGATLAIRALESGGFPELVMAALAVAIYWLANNALVGLAIGLAYGGVRTSAVQLVRSDTVMLAFGFGGAVCGVVMTEVGVWTGVATLVALLVALDVFVISVPAGLTVLRSAWAVVVARGVSGGVAGSVSALVTRSVALSAVGAVAGLAAGVVAGVLVVMLIVALRLLAHRRRVDAALLGGIALVELAFPLIGAITGVVTALAGFSAGLVCASALVIGGSACVAVRRRRSRNAPPEIDDDTAMVAVFEALLEGRPTPARER